jgi:hypothetical protein
MNEKSMLVAAAALWGVSIALGIVLAFSNQQYNTVVFTVHKIAALGAAVITFILCYRLIKAAPVSAIFYLAVVGAGISFILLCATGAVMSAGHGSYGLLKAVHIISTVLLAACEIRLIITFSNKLQ